MKNLVLSIILFLPMLCFAQDDPSTDKFIRIVGLAEKTIESDGLKIEFTLSEIQGNEYNQIRPKSLEEVKSEFTAYLKAENIESSLMEKDFMKNITKSNYGKGDTEVYSMRVKSQDEAVRISKLKVDGFKVNKVEFVFDDEYASYIEEMTIEAIEDAKRKASNIAKAVGKELGEILNIDDMKNLKFNSYSSSDKSKTLSYKVNVTFELK